MNKSVLVILCATAISVEAQFNQLGTSTYDTSAPSLVAPNSFVLEQGPHHRQWAYVTWVTNRSGQVVLQTNKTYVELQTGMAYMSNGQYVAAQEIIEGFPGGAIARQGQIQMIFPNDISAEPIDVQTPGGRFRTAVLCLSYADYAANTNLIIAEVQPCQGQIIAANQVLYPRAFSNRCGCFGSIHVPKARLGARHSH